jgi:hypothetical protein
MAPGYLCSSTSTHLSMDAPKRTCPARFTIPALVSPQWRLLPTLSITTFLLVDMHHRAFHRSLGSRDVRDI